MVEPRRLDEVFSILSSPDVFYTDAHQLTYQAIQDLYHRGSAIDFMTVIVELKAKGNLERCGGNYGVTKMTQHVVSSAHIEEHCRIIVQKYMQRELIRIAGDLLNEAYDDRADAFELMDYAHTHIDRLRMNNIAVPYRHLSDGSDKDLTELEDRMKNAERMISTLSGVDTGLRTVNALTNGWQPKELIILAARPSVGKTAFGLNLALNAATSPHKPVPVGFFSLEMDLEKLRQRITSRMSGVGLTNIASGRVTMEELHRVSGGLLKMRNVPLYIDDSFTLTTMDLKAKARKMMHQHGVGLIIVDYLQLVKPTDSRVIREQQVSQISRDLKGIAKELGLPVIALAQLNRDIEKRGNPEPTTADLRESGAIEQDADIVSFLYRLEDDVWYKIGKNRNGKCDKLPLSANMDLQHFAEKGDDSPAMAYKGFSPTPNAAPGGRMIPIDQANAKFLDEDHPLGF